MGLSHSPTIVTDGLVLCLDAANARSYPGAGTTWTDLSSTGASGTLTNGPTFDSANGGSIVFDGTDDYVSFGNLSTFNFTNNYTLSCWASVSATQNGDAALISKTTISDGYQGYMLWVQGGKVHMYLKGGIRATSSSIVTNDNIYYIVGTYDGSNAKVYLNAILDASSAYTNSADASNANLLVSAYDFTTPSQRSLGSNFTSAQVYSRALSADEVRRNYLATKGRFE